MGVTTLVESVNFGYPTGGGMGPAANTLFEDLWANTITVATMRIPIIMMVINWIAFLSFVRMPTSCSNGYHNGIVN